MHCVNNDWLLYYEPVIIRDYDHGRSEAKKYFKKNKKKFGGMMNVLYICIRNKTLYINQNRGQDC